MPIRPENRSRYPHDWARRSYFVRVVRARNRCEWCAAANGQPHPITGSIVVLTTAHVYDDRPEAASLFNLAALCQRCHNRHDAAARQARRRGRLGLPARAPSPQARRMALWDRIIRSVHGVPRSSAERRRQAMARLMRRSA